MPYRREICSAGKTRQYTYYYSARADQKGGSRKANENHTKEAQQKVNSRMAIKRLTWILNENFDGTSLYITWSYKKENRPKDKEEFKKTIDKLLRDIRKTYKGAGLDAKYVWVAELGQKGAAHIHMVLNAIDTQLLKKVWDKGWITIKPMDDTGQYRKLANYFVKYSEKTMKTLNGLQKRRYNASRNLTIPQPKKETVSQRKAYSHKIQVPPGWYVDKESIQEAWHEETGYMYFTYTLIYDGSSPRPGKESYKLDLETGEVQIEETRRKGSPRGHPGRGKDERDGRKKR